MDRLDSLNQTYIKTLLFKMAMILIIVGGINWLLFGVFDLNLVSVNFGECVVSTLIYTLIGISALAIMFDRDTYLPFLGPMVAPCSVLQDRSPPGATKEVKVIVNPRAKVLYWAAEPKNTKIEQIQSWKEAYLQYDNAGVATSDGEGVAVLKVRDPQSYKVPFKGTLRSHVHYRVCGEAGWMGRIQTVFLGETAPEGFENQLTDKNYKVTNLADRSASIY